MLSSNIPIFIAFVVGFGCGLVYERGGDRKPTFFGRLGAALMLAFLAAVAVAVVVGLTAGHHIDIHDQDHF